MSARVDMDIDVSCCGCRDSSDYFRFIIHLARHGFSVVRSRQTVEVGGSAILIILIIFSVIMLHEHLICLKCDAILVTCNM